MHAGKPWACLNFLITDISSISPDSPRHFDNVEIYTEQAIIGSVHLTRADMVLIALVSGGDYNVSGRILLQVTAGVTWWCRRAFQVVASK